MKTLKQFIEENPKCNKFLIWKEYGGVVKAIAIDDSDIDIFNPPSDKINWFKVIFNKKYRYALKACFDYAVYHADTFRGEGSAWVTTAVNCNTNIPTRMGNNVEEYCEI